MNENNESMGNNNDTPNEQPMDKGEIFKTFDEADEEQIEAELKGAVAEEMVYSFSVGGQRITGLSKAGTWAVMRAFNKTALKSKKPIIVLSPVKDGVLTESEAGFGFVANASLFDIESGIVLENGGGGSQASKKDSRGREDSFALAKAVTKAQRNAIRVLLPDDVVNKHIEKWSKQQKVRQFMSRPLGNSSPVNSSMECEDCGKPLNPKEVDYYSSHPNVARRCYNCNLKRKGGV